MILKEIVAALIGPNKSEGQIEQRNIEVNNRQGIENRYRE